MVNYEPTVQAYNLTLPADLILFLYLALMEKNIGTWVITFLSRRKLLPNINNKDFSVLSTLQSPNIILENMEIKIQNADRYNKYDYYTNSFVCPEQLSVSIHSVKLFLSFPNFQPFQKYISQILISKVLR